MSIPSFGLGTFRLTGQAVIDSVSSALQLGYRAIDTAQIYKNEADVGQAIAESGVARSELFITTKIWTEHLAAGELVPSLQESLHKLRSGAVEAAPGSSANVPRGSAAPAPPAPSPGRFALHGLPAIPSRTGRD